MSAQDFETFYRSMSRAVVAASPSPAAVTTGTSSEGTGSAAQQQKYHRHVQEQARMIRNKIADFRRLDFESPGFQCDTD